MKLLFICNEYPPAPHGGIGIVVRDLAEYLVLIGHDVLILGFDKSIDKDKEEIQKGVKVRRLFNPYLNNGFRVGPYHIGLSPILQRKYLSKELEKQIEQFNPDLIESYDWSGPLWAKPSRHLIVRMHGANTAYQHFEKKRFSRLLYFFEKRNIKMSDHLLSVSKHMAELTLESLHLDRQYSVIHNCVDTNYFKPDLSITNDRDLILYVGRIHPRKGLEELFKTMNFILDKRPQTRLQLIGAYDESFKLFLNNIIKKEYASQIEFKGKIEHAKLVEHYNNASLVVVPSRAEAFGLVAIEAMSCQTPVFMSNKASGPEIIEHGKGAYLVDFGNHEKVSDLIENTLNKQDLILNLGKMARKHVLDHFSNDQILKENLSFYQSLLVH